MNVACISKVSTYDWLKRDNVGIKPYFVNTPLDALKAVSLGSADATILNLANVTYLIEKNGLTNLKIAAPTSYGNYNLSIAIRKDWPELASIFNKGLETISQKKHNEIRQKWIAVRYEHGIRLRDVIKWLLLISLFSTILLTAFYFWNRILKKEINERELAEESLVESEKRYRLLYTNTPAMLHSIDLNGKIVTVSDLWLKKLGYRKEEVIGFKSSDFLTEESKRYASEKVLPDFFQKGYCTNINYKFVKKNGEELDILLSATAERDAEGNVIRSLAVLQDVTERLRLEHQLRQTHKMEAIGTLAGGIAHDFNNILTAILGNINLVLFDEDLNYKSKKLLSAAEKASLRAKDLTQQLLTFAKGGEPIKKASSLESIIIDSANFVLHGDKVSCRFDIPENLWLAEVDEGQISQVVQNIVLNARQAIPGGGNITITCKNVLSDDEQSKMLLPQGRFVRISIQDSGIGMPANAIESIFDPYFTTKQDGSGLGLAITHSIIMKHNGHISVDSSPGVGTTFTIYLPASDKKKEQKQKSFSADIDKSQAKILIMDDEGIVRDVAKAMLVQLGHNVVLSANGEEAVKLYQQSVDSGNAFNLIVMDLTIPGSMGGKEAVQEVLKINPNVKVIVASGYSNDPIVANYKDYGFCSAIEKPFKLQDFAEVIGKVLA